MTNTDISPIPADTKDWTVVLREGCAQCGFTPGYPYSQNVQKLRALVPAIEQAFERSAEDLHLRPNEVTWAPIEYLAHISEVCTVMVERLHLMLNQDAPEFPNWDQDDAAVEGAYLDRSADQVKGDLLTNLEAAAVEFEQVPADALDRKGLRGDGGAFTVRTLAEYFVHDMEHHVQEDL